MSDTPITTLHLDTGRAMRGGQRQVALLAAQLIQQGHGVTVVAPHGAPLGEAIGTLGGARAIACAMRGELALGASWRIARLLRREPIDLVHAHTPHAITILHIARLLGRSVPLIAHRRVAFPLRRNRLSRVKRGFPDRYIAVSQVVRAALVADGVPDERIRVVPSALDPARSTARESRSAVRAALGLPEHDHVIGSIGALDPQKGHRGLIEAFARSRAGASSWLVIVGSGPEHATLEAEARARGVASRVRFAGERNDVASVLGAIDLFVFPSRESEGSPAALKEAIAIGLPVLASDLPGHAELGLDASARFAAGDAAALAALLEAALADLAGFRVAMAPARAVIASLTPERLAAETLAVYREVLAAPR